MRILKIDTLPPQKQWIDRDEIMIHACFQILVDCVDTEHVDTQCSYEAHHEFVDEVRYLYNWWKNRDHTKITDQQTIEDDLMLTRLMKIRSALWV